MLLVVGALVVALVASDGGARLAAGDARASRSNASVHLVATAPVSVGGVGFKVREQVVVRVQLPGRSALSKVVTATAVGRFVVAFPGSAVPACGAVRVSAVGSRGSRATLWEPPPPCGLVIAP